MKQEPFRKYNLGEKKQDAFTVWLNKEERAMLEEAKIILEQEKDSTAFKQLAKLGSELLGEEKTKRLLSLVFKNKRNNKRIGVTEFG